MHRGRILQRWLLGFLLGLLIVAAGPAMPASRAPVQAQEATPVPKNTGNNYYGINFIAPWQPWLGIAYNSGARTVRWQFDWRDAEPDSGNFQWEKFDGYVNAWNKSGIEIHGILHNPPDFMLSHGLVPRNLGLQYDSSDSSFARYCFRFAERYRGKISSYEVWNEPDLEQYWGGTAEEYMDLLRGCYRGIKAADPNVPVVLAGMAYTTNRVFTRQILKLARESPDGAANNYYFDVMGLHMYGDPEYVYKHTREVRGIMIDQGFADKPIWITETNVPLRGEHGVPNTPARGLATTQEGGWYVLQAASNALAAGAEKLMFFRLADDEMHGEAWGLVNNSGTPRPGYTSLQLASSVLKEITSASREVQDGVVITTLRRLDSGRVVTLYQQDGRPAAVTVPAEYAAGTLITETGKYLPIVPDGAGLYHITIPGATGRNFEEPWLYIVGGPVLMIVEYDKEAPAASVEVVALPDDPQHVMVKWGGDDGRLGTGVKSYEVEYNDNGAGWVTWFPNTTDTQAIFDISGGGQFGFRARATDNVGNVGEFSEPIGAELRIIGTVLAHVVDLRGQDIPAARLTLSDGTLYDTDATGWAKIEVPPGTVHITGVDGGANGSADEQDPVEIALAEEVSLRIQLQPRNLITNGALDSSLSGWTLSALSDAGLVVTDPATKQGVLRITGQRRPWGSPAAEMTVSLPPDLTDPIVSFQYHLSGGGQMLLVRAITPEIQMVLWQQITPNTGLSRVWFDVPQLAGKTTILRFELWGPKGGPISVADIDDVVVGNVPILGPPTPESP